ncbi:hypothetical protein [Amycolatopsis panacis]|uniref:hypothetical protein n=1 Tax=Amycolatopsis panacis TaxID=2340917 RepID=UPI001F32A526|nr:hypothetical protein [Amycolatopsis panacis]
MRKTLTPTMLRPTANQPLVGERRGRHVGHLLRRVEPAQLLGESPLAAKPVDRTVPRGGDQPGARNVRHAVDRPPLRGDGERLLGRVFSDV